MLNLNWGPLNSTFFLLAITQTKIYCGTQSWPQNAGVFNQKMHIGPFNPIKIYFQVQSDINEFGFHLAHLPKN